MRIVLIYLNTENTLDILPIARILLRMISLRKADTDEAEIF